MKINKLKRSPYPVGLIIDIHDYCNAKCKMCPYPSLHKKLNQGRMDWSLYTKIIDDFSALIAQYKFKGMVAYCNMGEPFMEENLFKFTSYAEQKGINVYLNTNASLMSPSKLDRLFQSGFHGSFNISFHAASKELYRDIMGLDQGKTLKNVKYLLENYSKERISINTLNYQWPPDEEKNIKKLFASLDLDVEINTPISRAGLLNIYRKSTGNKIAGCGPERVLYQMVIAHNGNVLLCCNDMARVTTTGNLREKKIQQIWNGEEFQEYLQKIYFGKSSPPEFICKHCEESVPFWSARRIIKTILPKKVLHFLRRKKKKDWVLSKAMK